MMPVAAPLAAGAGVGRARAFASFAHAILRKPSGLAGTIILGVFSCLAAVPDLFVGPLQTAASATGDFLQPPDAHRLLGTDEVGRDVANLVVHGARVSITIGVLATLITIVVGAGVGLASGYFGGWLDSLLMRTTDFFFVVPPFVLALAIAPLALEKLGATGEIMGFRPSLFVIVLVIGLTSWPFMARIVRSETLSLRERPFVDRARLAGTGPFTIMGKHILPNVVPQIAANAALTIAGAVATETALSFIGLGDPLEPSWGTILFLAQQAGAASTGAWWYVGSPGVCVLLLVLGFVLVGDALDNVLNPRRQVIP